MKYGTINCSCGQEFYFETERNKIACIRCKRIYDVADFEDLSQSEEEELLEEDLENG